MKRFLALALSLALMLTLTACGGGGTTNSGSSASGSSSSGSSGSASSSGDASKSGDYSFSSSLQPDEEYPMIDDSNCAEYWENPMDYHGDRVSVVLNVLEPPIEMDSYQILLANLVGHENYRITTTVESDFKAEAGDTFLLKGPINADSSSVNADGTVIVTLQMSADEITPIDLDSVD